MAQDVGKVTGTSTFSSADDAVQGVSDVMKLYGFSRVNSLAYGLTRDLRVLWALEELELPFELVGLDHPGGELDTLSYRHISPFAQIPVLEDGSIVLSESGAILIYLARKAGKLIPADAAGEAQVIRWCFAALDTVELATLNIFLIDGGFGADPQHPSTALRARSSVSQGSGALV
jgi:glutathione S-transferase